VHGCRIRCFRWRVAGGRLKVRVKLFRAELIPYRLLDPQAQVDVKFSSYHPVGVFFNSKAYPCAWDDKRCIEWYHQCVELKQQLPRRLWSQIEAPIFSCFPVCDRPTDKLFRGSGAIFMLLVCLGRQKSVFRRVGLVVSDGRPLGDPSPSTSTDLTSSTLITII
jgi:hypothetical protein